MKQSYKSRSSNLNTWNILVALNYSVKPKNLLEDYKTAGWVSVWPPPDVITHSKLGRVMPYSDHHRSCQQAVPTLSLPQSSCSASELPSLRLFSSGLSSGLSIGPLVLSQEVPECEVWPSPASAGSSQSRLPSASVSSAFFSRILLLISFWNLHICSCSSLMKFTTVWQTQQGKKWRQTLRKRELLQRRCADGGLHCLLLLYNSMLDCCRLLLTFSPHGQIAHM